MSVDLMGVLRAFADFLTRFDDPACAPIRMKFCALCDTTLDSLAKVGIRKDVYHRQTILEMITGWLQDPSTVRCRKILEGATLIYLFAGSKPTAAVRSQCDVVKDPRQIVREVGN